MPTVSLITFLPDVAPGAACAPYPLATCSLGTYNPARGSNSPAACVLCPAGTRPHCCSHLFFMEYTVFTHPVIPMCYFLPLGAEGTSNALVGQALPSACKSCAPGTYGPYPMLPSCLCVLLGFALLKGGWLLLPHLRMACPSACSWLTRFALDGVIVFALPAPVLLEATSPQLATRAAPAACALREHTSPRRGRLIAAAASAAQISVPRATLAAAPAWTAFRWTAPPATFWYTKRFTPSHPCSGTLWRGAVFLAQAQKVHRQAVPSP